MTQCIKCDAELSAENTTWYRQKNHIHKCNSCIREEKRVWAISERARNPSLIAERNRKSKAKIRLIDPKRYSAGQMRASAKKRAKALGLPFSVDVKYIVSISPRFCPVLGQAIKYGGGEKTDWSASLDRINPSKGYVPGNVQVISLLANTMKNKASPEEMIAFAEWVFSTYGHMRTAEKAMGKAK